MAAAVADWHTTLSSMVRVDTLFINTGDPGGQSPPEKKGGKGRPGDDLEGRVV